MRNSGDFLVLTLLLAYNVHPLYNNTTRVIDSKQKTFKTRGISEQNFCRDFNKFETGTHILGDTIH